MLPHEAKTIFTLFFFDLVELLPYFVNIVNS